MAITHKDLQLLKDSLTYNPKTGQFFRMIRCIAPAKLCWSNRNATIKVAKDGYAKYHNAWRVAMFLATGYYPGPEDSIQYKDGDVANLKLENLIVVYPADDEQTILDFATEHGLSPQTVHARMKYADRSPRQIRNYTVNYFKKADFAKLCGDMIGKPRQRASKDDEFFQKKRFNFSESKRKNKMVRTFLAQHFITPKQWEMTLC